MRRHQRDEALQGRLRDYAVYVAVGLSLVAVAYWSAVRFTVEEAHGFYKWLALAVQTMVLFGYIIRGTKPSGGVGLSGLHFVLRL